MLIYENSSDIRFRPSLDVATLVVGLALGIWYVRNIFGAIAGDIKDLPASFNESPSLTLIFIVVKASGYLFFATVFGLSIYAPIRNLFLKRVISGPLIEVNARESARGHCTLVFLIGKHEFAVPLSSNLESALQEALSSKLELRVTSGAFNRVFRIEALN